MARLRQAEREVHGRRHQAALWRILFLAETYGRMTLTLDEVAEQIGLAPGTIRNHRTRGEFTWLRADGRQLTADVEDVARYIHEMYRSAAAEARATAYTAAPTVRPFSRRRRLVR